MGEKEEKSVKFLSLALCSIILKTPKKQETTRKSSYSDRDEASVGRILPEWSSGEQKFLL